MIAHRRVDAVGVFVLVGIALGAVIGVISHSARLVLAEGSVPTGVFGLICLGSLLTRRPLMFRLASEFMGPDTPKGREFDGLWRYAEFRRPFRILTAVWGVAYLAEAAARIVIVEHTSAGLAFAISKVMPIAVTAVLALWTVAYSLYHREKGRRLAAAAAERNAAQGAGPAPMTPTAAAGPPSGDGA